MTVVQGMADSEKVAIPRFTIYGTNLTDAHLGARVIFSTDEFFAVADNLLKREAPEFDPNAYCSQGKVMDGWESRRRRVSTLFIDISSLHLLLPLTHFFSFCVAATWS